MKIKVSVAIEKKLVERLDKIAAINGESRSQLIDRMVKEQIAMAEQFANLMANPEARAAMLKEFANPKVLNPILRSMGEKPTPALSKEIHETAERIGIGAGGVKTKGKGKKS